MPDDIRTIEDVTKYFESKTEKVKAAPPRMKRPKKLPRGIFVRKDRDGAWFYIRYTDRQGRETEILVALHSGMRRTMTRHSNR